MRIHEQPNTTKSFLSVLFRCRADLLHFLVCYVISIIFTPYIIFARFSILISLVILEDVPFYYCSCFAFSNHVNRVIHPY